MILQGKIIISNLSGTDTVYSVNLSLFVLVLYIYIYFLTNCRRKCTQANLYILLRYNRQFFIIESINSVHAITISDFY